MGATLLYLVIILAPCASATLHVSSTVMCALAKHSRLRPLGVPLKAANSLNLNARKHKKHHWRVRVLLCLKVSKAKALYHFKHNICNRIIENLNCSQKHTCMHVEKMEFKIIILYLLQEIFTRIDGASN